MDSDVSDFSIGNESRHWITRTRRVVNEALYIMKDALIVLVAVGLLIGLSYAGGLWYFGGFWVTVLIALAIWEGIAYVRTGQTLSQRFGEKIRTQPWWGWGLLALYGLFFGALLWHLAAMR